MVKNILAISSFPKLNYIYKNKCLSKTKLLSTISKQRRLEANLIAAKLAENTKKPKLLLSSSYILSRMGNNIGKNIA